MIPIYGLLQSSMIQDSQRQSREAEILKSEVACDRVKLRHAGGGE
jgi:hypothetical protein